ncbi:MAG: heat-inducible transcriptional repressor HrcA [Bryobacterales bacterium]|nr:heat-inducible transcriptional repressor HrcA [Bryobacterales bacterium]
MVRNPVLSPRNAEILHSIVETYIQTGQPVASRTISKRTKTGLSPASIRNVMADLSEEGYLEQPHTSAGRIPTEKAFRVYVQSLAVRRLKASQIERLRAELQAVETIEGRAERSSHVLTELTGNVGIAATIPAASQTLHQVELLALADGRILMIVVTRDGVVRERIVSLEERLSQQELDAVRNYLNWNFSGWVLEEARRELARRLEQESALYDAILRRLVLLRRKGLLDFELAPSLYLEGTANLIGLDLHLTREKMRELLRALEEKKRVLQILDRFLEKPSGQVEVQVGLGEAHPSMKALSLIGVKVMLPGGLSAKIAVLGPIRMNYERVISAVMHVGDVFRSLPV